MSKNQINEMIEFEKQIFKSRRRYYTHNYTLYRLDSIIDTTIKTSEYKPIKDLSDYVSDERLIKAFKRYPTFKDISVLLDQGYDIKSIAKTLNKTPNAIHIILFKVRKTIRISNNQTKEIMTMKKIKRGEIRVCDLGEGYGSSRYEKY